MLQTNSMSELTNYNIEDATNCVINTRFCIAVLVTRKCWMLSIFSPKWEKQQLKEALFKYGSI